MTAANDNPYAPPQSSEEEPVFPSDDRPVEGYRHGKRVVLSVGAQLPRRCYFCNAKADGFREIVHRGWARRRFNLPDVEARFWLCDKHRNWGSSRRYAERALSLLMVLAFITLSQSGVWSPRRWLGFIAAIFGIQIAMGFLVGPRVSSRPLGENHVELRGAGKPFPDSLPKWDTKQATATQSPPP